MKEPIWISAEEAETGNKYLVAQFGGLDAGIRDTNLFHAALARPLNKWHYDSPKPTLYTLAAAYAYGIAKGHVFHDGNKRTAYLIAITFLEMNGIICAPDQEELVVAMISVAEGSMGEEQLAAWFAKNAHRIRGLSEESAEPALPFETPGRNPQLAKVTGKIPKGKAGRSRALSKRRPA